MTVDSIREEFLKDKEALAVDDLRIAYLGRKGKVSTLFATIKELEPSERGAFGQAVNELKGFIESEIESLQSATATKEVIDVLPVSPDSIPEEQGRLSLISRTIYEIQDIFEKMGFGVVEGPQWENEYYNFDTLNIPAHHPARDMWDTIWIDKMDGDKKTLLRTHTSPVQVRYIETHEPPYRIISPGAVYRYEATDATHETVFHQVEGFMIDEHISIATFKGVMKEFFSQMLGEEVDVRLRPSYFPFTEPSFEMDITWKDGWLEVGGAGMMHREVLKHSKRYDDKLQGFAFGVGVERLVLLKYQIDDIRLFHSADLKFLQQFK
jgi:phenylalanyl-tRNA synthetase alpha chain